MKRLAIITTHPIQYHSPLFSELSKKENLSVKIFYTWGEEAKETKYDPGFKREVKWDIPLLEGYEYSFVENVAKDKGSHHFKGIDNPTLVKEIEDWKADAVLVFGWSFKSHLHALKHFKGKIPALFRGDSNLLDRKRSLKEVLKFFFLRHVYSFIDTAFYVGTNNKKYFRHYGLKDRQLVFAPHAVDNTRFSNGREKRKEWREKLGIGENDLVFLFAGKLEVKKDPELLIKAFGRIVQKDTHLVVVGNGPQESYLKGSYSNLINLHFVDFQNQSAMPGVYQMCDVFVLPSQGPFETWGLAVNEAMASGKAVIASDKVGCAIDLVKPGVNGYIIKAKDENGLAEKMKTFADDRMLASKMAEQSKLIIQNWSIRAVADAIADRLTK